MFAAANKATGQSVHVTRSNFDGSQASLSWSRGD